MAHDTIFSLPEGVSKNVTFHNLQDWRAGDGEQEYEANEMALAISTQGHRIDIVDAGPAGQQRALWIELEGDALKVHVFDSAHDEPVTVHILDGALKVDLSARQDDPAQSRL